MTCFFHQLSSYILIHPSTYLFGCHSRVTPFAGQGLSIGQVITSIYLKVSVSDFLTLFSARSGEDYFWTSRPAPILLAAAAFSLGLSTILACSWPEGTVDDVYSIGLEYREPKSLAFVIWLYCIARWLIQDVAKVWFYKLMKYHNWFSWNQTGKVVASEDVKKFIVEHSVGDMEAAGHISSSSSSSSSSLAVSASKASIISSKQEKQKKPSGAATASSTAPTSRQQNNNNEEKAENDDEGDVLDEGYP